MESGAVGRSDDPPDLETRDSLCISLPAPNAILHKGDDGFEQETRRLFKSAENNAVERLVKLKAALKAARKEEDFWTMATEGIAEITGAQYGFISKRMVVDDEDASVEMPPFGTPGSCLMSQAWYFNDGQGNIGNPRNVKYKVYGCPCEHMKHDKVLLIPERLNELILDNPNKAGFIVPVEAYLALPLFDRDGRCFAHFGAMWSKEGTAKIQLSWAFMEMMLHSLEDILLTGFLERGRFATALKAASNPNGVIPHEAVTAAQSLKPYARNLSHELRTPMQGVVGMLDVMYATVQEASEGQEDAAVRAVFENLKESIEVVQDSSRRAVEAADNVVHAYDMNMGVPETPISPPEEYENQRDNRSLSARKDRRPDIVVTGENVPINFKRNKRRRESQGQSNGQSSKQRRIEKIPSSVKVENTSYPTILDDLASDFSLSSKEPVHDPPLYIMSPTRAHLEASEQATVPPGLRHTNLRDVLQFLVNDLLKVGGRPDSAIAQETAGGEYIEVRSRSPNGDEKAKTVFWSVDPGVPETILIETQSLVKVISSIYSNAIKFTEEGSVTLTARLSPKSRYIVLNVKDTGMGIREEFVPKLFQPFSKEDDSLTRQSEGLGLGLMVAKGLARKLGGDLSLIRTETSGPNRGSEFEMRVPVTPNDISSRPSTPSGSPPPSARSRHSTNDGPVSMEEFAAGTRSRAGSLRTVPPTSNNRSSPSRKSKSNSPSVIQQPTPSSPRHLHVASSSSIALVKASNAVNGRPLPNKRSLDFDRDLAQKYPLNFLVVEDNKINRKLLVSMLRRLGYEVVHEAYDGAHAVRQMKSFGSTVDVVLMDLWMPYMDGYEASEKILGMDWDDPDADPKNVEKEIKGKKPTILAVTADVTDGALEKAARVGMKGFLTKPFKVVDLERLILEYCATRQPGEPVAETIVVP